MQWERILRDAVNEGEIRELHLRHVPTLKTCENWNDVKEIGLINHRTKYAHYHGIIVKYGERIFYVPEERMQALAPYRQWKTKKSLKVTEPEKK
ncbi:MAG: hypothetical protein H7A21_13670 [Spirochaetales bacterium]|nr:hypothetical protein [Leptospiraceae bacterium]MCP5482479.1 hypothetical protein [Spirochaetales bacterium]MCP5485817.1 hypothetical protein [Spirochaetales bacterium]